MQRKKIYNRLTYLLYSTLILLVSLSGCKRSDEYSKSVEAEHISYKVVYLDKLAGDIPTNYLPGVMEAYYTKRYVKTSIKGFFGQFSLVQIANLRQNTVTTMLNFFGNKVYYTGKRGEIPAGIAPLKDPKMKVSNDTRTICSMLSRKAIITTTDNVYNVYFIEDIDIKSPNITTPYNFIDYVLSDFRVQLSILKMQLIMSDRKSETISTSMFLIPEDYEQLTSRESMESIINSLFTKDK